MAYGDFAQSGGYDLGGSASEAFNPIQILKAMFLFVVFGFLLGIQELISGLDKVGQMNGAWRDYILAVLTAMKVGISKALGSMWVVIIRPQEYFQTSSYGSIAFAVFSLFALIGLFYQPISILINALDGKAGQVSGMPLRLFVSFILVIIASCIVYYAFGGATITNTLGHNIPAVVANVTDATTAVDVTNTSAVISLL